MKPIHTPNAPQPAGHYAQAILHGGLIYVAGQLPVDPDRPDAPLGSIEEQTRQALRNVDAILEAAGSSLDRLVQVTVYVADIRLWNQVNEAYAEVLGAHRPARAVVPVNELHHGYQIEIQAIAAAD